ncbi:hypothetical protein EPN42_01420 [bacterium]|nr:MAG: hypothetical protein EPN42_01420 [bacterium]
MPERQARLRGAAQRGAKAQGNDELNDDAKQDAILHPKPVTVTIGGEEVALYPLSGRKSRELMGFANEVVGATSVREGAFAPRLVAVLTMGRFVDRLLLLIAESTAQEPGTLPEAQIETIAAELDQRSQSPRGALELAAAFNAIWSLNDLDKAFSPNA